MESAASLIGKCSTLEKSIFCQVISDGPLSKADLLNKLNLKHATMCRAVDSLIEKELLLQTAGGESSNVGRKPKLLCVKPNSFYLIGVDISRMYLGIALTNACLKKIDYFEYELSEITSPEFITNKIQSHITNLLEKYSIDRRKVLGLGIGAVGKIEKHHGIIVYADNFGAEWKNVPIKEMLQKKLDIPVILENGANAAAFAEFMMGSARNYPHVLFVSLGIGVRCGVINEGKIVKNINNIDSSYGHIVIEPSGKKCSCGNYGCMAMYSTVKPMVEEYKKMCKFQNSRMHLDTIESIRFRDIVNLSQNGDMTASNILINAAVYMGIGLANIISILNPEIVVLGGIIIERSDLYYNKAVEVAKSRIYRIEDRNLTFTKSHFEKEATSIGICALMLEDSFNNVQR